MKIIKSIVLYIVVCLTLVTSASAVNSDSQSAANTTTEYSSVARTEEVKWYYKPINGVEHKRLWSLTRGIWLTDWIPC